MIHTAYCSICKKDVAISGILFHTGEHRIYLSLTCGHVCKVVLTLPMVLGDPDDFIMEEAT